MIRISPKRAVIYGAFLIASVLYGCDHWNIKVNEQRVSLLPEPVARKIAAKYISEEWLANPYVNTPYWCSTRRAYAPIARMEVLNASGYYIWHIGDNACAGGNFYVSKVSSPEERHELTEALVSLGAAISK
jgi:hypothetical protein